MFNKTVERHRGTKDEPISWKLSHKKRMWQGLVNKYRGEGVGRSKWGVGSLDVEPSQRDGSLNFELAKGGGSSY